MPDYEYPKMSRGEYEKAIDALLMTIYKEAGWKERDLRKLKQNALDRFDLEGWHVGLPMVSEIMARGRAPNAWESEYQKKLEDWQNEITKLTQEDWANKFAVEKWESSRDLAERQFAWQQQVQQYNWQLQSQKDMFEQRNLEEQLQRARQAALSTGIGRRTEARFQGQENPISPDKARIWEATRNEIISKLDKDRDYIKLYKIKNERNPYAKPTESPTDERVWAQDELKKAREWVKTADDLLKTAKDPETQLTPEEMNYVYMAYQAKENALKAVAQATAKEQGWAQQQGFYAGAGAKGTGMETATGITYGAGAPPVIDKPSMPKTPTWLSAMQPELGKRLPEKGKPIIPPSGQSWQQLTPSQQTKWWGTAEYYKQRPEDILSLMAKMQPKTPIVPNRWGVMRQYA